MHCEAMYGYRSCPDCGLAVQAARLASDEHDCATDRYVDHQVLKARSGLDRLEQDLARWLHTPQGRFAVFSARLSAR
jgi:hypothetical protein